MSYAFLPLSDLSREQKKIPGDVAKSALLPSGMDQIDTNNKYTNTITTRDGWIDGPRTVSVAENED